MSEPATRGLCNHDVCITCSDQAVAVRVSELLPDSRARVEAGDAIEEVSVDLIDAVVGDIVLVHAGVAIGKVLLSP